MRRFTLRLTALLLAFCVQLQGHALPPLADRLLIHLEANGQAGTYRWLKSIADKERGNAEYYDWVGRFAMELGDYAHAITALERLIELEPRHMGARLDLVLALQFVGRSFEARSRLQELHSLLPDEQNRLPKQARLQLQELDKLLAPDSDLPPRKFSAVVSTGIGHDSNANRGSDSDTIKIRLPGGVPIELALAPESVKTADEFIEAALHFEYGRRGNGCRFEPCRQWQAGALTRRYQSLDDYNQRQLYLATRKTFGGRYQREYTLTLQNVVSSKLEFDRLDEQNIGGLEYRQLLTVKHQVSGLAKLEIIDEKSRNQRTSQVGTLGLAGHVSLPTQPGFRPQGRRVSWEIAGSHHRRPDYFSGDTQRLWVGAHYPFLLGESWYFNVGLNYRLRKDDKPFSPAFFGSTVRQDHEWLLTAQVQRPLGDWLLSSRFSYEQTSSNIPLFDVNRLQWSISLAYQLL